MFIHVLVIEFCWECGCAQIEVPRDADRRRLGQREQAEVDAALAGRCRPHAAQTALVVSVLIFVLVSVFQVLFPCIKVVTIF